MTTRLKKVLAFGVSVLAGLLLTVNPVMSQQAQLVFGSSSGTTQVIKATSNALWVSLQSGAPTLGVGSCGTPSGTIIFYVCTNADATQIAKFENTSATSNALEQVTVANGTIKLNFGATNASFGSSTPGGASRSWLELANLSGTGIDFLGPNAAANFRFYSGGETSSNLKATIDINGVTLGNGATFIPTTASMAVANVGANSCGTTAATIAGGNNVFVITVGATSGSQCRVTFTLAATTEWDCVEEDQTTAAVPARKVVPVDSTHTDFFGTYGAGDKITGICFPR